MEYKIICHTIHFNRDVGNLKHQTETNTNSSQKSQYRSRILKLLRTLSFSKETSFLNNTTFMRNEKQVEVYKMIVIPFYLLQGTYTEKHV